MHFPSLDNVTKFHKISERITK